VLAAVRVVVLVLSLSFLVGLVTLAHVQKRQLVPILPQLADESVVALAAPPTYGSNVHSAGTTSDTAEMAGPADGEPPVQTQTNEAVECDSEASNPSSAEAPIQSQAPGDSVKHSGVHNSNSSSEISREQLLATSSVIFLKSVEKSNDALAVQISALSREAFGADEDAMRTRKAEHVAALLIEGEVVSYASYSVRRDLLSLSVSKLAVAVAYRRRGLGRTMLRHLIQMAKCRTRGEPPLEVVCLSSLPTSVNFYKACAFHEDHTVKLTCSSDVIEGQVYMEYRLRRSARSASRARSASKARSTSSKRAR